MQAAIKKSITALDPKGENTVFIEEVLEPVFQGLSRSTVDAVGTLSDADVDAYRTALKAQQLSLKNKMESLRTASSVQMKSQQAALEANFSSTLKAQVETAKGDVGVELKEAQEKIVDLEAELNSTVRNLDRVEDTNKHMKSIVRSREIEAEHAKMQQMKMGQELEKFKNAVPSLATWLSEAASQIERIALYNPATQGDAIAKEIAAVRDQINQRVKQVAKGEFEDAGEQVTRIFSDLAEADKKRVAAEEASALALSEAEAARAEVAASSAGALRQAKAEIEELEHQKQAVGEELDAKRDELEQIRRDLSEKLNRTYNEAERAALQSAEECKRQIEAMANRLRKELNLVRKQERESAQKQLARLLEEMSDMSKMHANMEAKLNTALAEAAKTASLVKRLQWLEAQERESRLAIAYAEQPLGAGPPMSPMSPGSPTGVPPRSPSPQTTRSAHAIPFAELLKKLLDQYKFFKTEAGFMRMQLDRELLGFNLTTHEHATLRDRLTQVLTEYGFMKEDASRLRNVLDHAIVDVAITVGENANLSDKLRTLLSEFQRVGDSERGMRKALKAKQNSLQNAIHRVKEIESELRQAHGAHAESKEALTLAALNALSSLRMRLGSVHAVRPEALKPVDEAIKVKRLTISASMGSLPVGRDAAEYYYPKDEAATPARSNFVERIVDTAGYASPGRGAPTRTPLPPVTGSPNWSPERSQLVENGSRFQLRVDRPKSLRVPNPPGAGGLRADEDLLGPMMKQIISL